MRNILLCEGSTDYFLLQYYLRVANNWEDDRRGSLNIPRQPSRDLKKGTDILTIMSVGGCSRMQEGLKTVLDRNFLSTPSLSDVYSKIVIVTDHDEIGTEQEFITKIEDTLDSYNISYESSKLKNDTWVSCSMNNQLGIEIPFSLLLLVIPFEDIGAMETFLLNAIGSKDLYDKIIIDKCNTFVNQIDPDKKYLSSRRHITKAKFDTYFSVRTPVEQFQERQNILKSVKREDYEQIQVAFKKFKDL